MPLYLKQVSACNVSLAFNVSISESNNVTSSGITEIHYRANRQRLKDTAVNLNSKSNSLQFSINMTFVPKGPHWLEVYATAKGSLFETHLCLGAPPTETIIEFVSYKIPFSSMVNFTIDTTPSIIFELSMDNKTCLTSNVTLNFIVNESVSQVSYSLDGQEKVTIDGNTTLANLPYGMHNVTVYATDRVGHIGASETTCFTIVEPFPTTTLIVAFITTVAVIAVGFLL